MEQGTPQKKGQHYKTVQFLKERERQYIQTTENTREKPSKTINSKKPRQWDSCVAKRRYYSVLRSGVVS